MNAELAVVPPPMKWKGRSTNIERSMWETGWIYDQFLERGSYGQISVRCELTF